MSKEKQHKNKKDQQEEMPQNGHEEKLAENISDELNKLHEENAELLNKLQRVTADYANFQKRVPRQVADTVTYEKEKIIKSLLPALDNFEHALSNAEKADNVEAVAEGVKMVYDQMLDILKSHGVVQIQAKDQEFNPSEHQAMMKQHDPDKQDNIVLEEFQRGYKLNERVIRPSKVVVNKLQNPEDQQEQAGEE